MEEVNTAICYNTTKLLSRDPAPFCIAFQEEKCITQAPTYQLSVTSTRFMAHFALGLEQEPNI